jgi:N-alpha-acetyltransferase 10/11
MKCAEISLYHFYRVCTITLHVRVSNNAAINLYQKKLGFLFDSVDEKYYADGENAHSMRKNLNKA